MGITPQQFEAMRQRVGGGGRSPAPVHAAAVARTVSKHSLVLGIDSSLRGTGYGIVRLGKPQNAAVAFGTIRCPAGWERSRCLAHIAMTLRDLVKKHQPEVCVMEALFYAQNLQTAIIMGEARGACLAAIAESGIEVYEIATRKVKQAMVGYGAAQKSAVARMVQRMLLLPEQPEPDAADALAVALAYAQETGRYSLAAPKKI